MDKFYVLFEMTWLTHKSLTLRDDKVEISSAVEEYINDSDGYLSLRKLSVLQGDRGGSFALLSR